MIGLTEIKGSIWVILLILEKLYGLYQEKPKAVSNMLWESPKTRL